MKEIKIDLAQPFEVILTKLLSVPPTTDIPTLSTRENVHPQAKLKEALRGLYEAAHGRQVATSIGLVAIAPPVAAYLVEAPFYIETQADFLSQALARLEVSPPPRAVATPTKFLRERITNRRISSFTPTALHSPTPQLAAGTTK
ncbi:MAG: hypothetical protein ABI016_07440 [Chthoniobacterales bacterium]